VTAAAGLPHIGAAVGREPWSNPQGSLFFSRVGGDSTTSAKAISLMADRWRQSPAYEGDSGSRALAIPSPSRGSFFCMVLPLPREIRLAPRLVR
jgi:hypothetical protein